MKELLRLGSDFKVILVSLSNHLPVAHLLCAVRPVFYYKNTFTSNFGSLPPTTLNLLNLVFLSASKGPTEAGIAVVGCRPFSSGRLLLVASWHSLEETCYIFASLQSHFTSASWRAKQGCNRLYQSVVSNVHYPFVFKNCGIFMATDAAI